MSSTASSGQSAARPLTHVRTAVIPAAGLGTRFLPATKSVPKELLPIVDTPAIEYVVAEASAAGITDVLLISGRGKVAIVDHFDSSPGLEALLAEKGDDVRLAAVQRSSNLAQVHSVRQGQPKGLGHAVLQAAAHVGDRPFAVLLGDDLIDPRDPLLATMLEVQESHGGSVVALMEVPADQVHLYGCAALAAGTDHAADVVHVADLIEKPAVQDAPSNLAIIGRYVLSPDVFDELEKTGPGRGGEIQLTDALAVLARRGQLRGVVFRGRRYDTGDRLGWLKATIRLSCEREDLGPALLAWLHELVAELAAELPA